MDSIKQIPNREGMEREEQSSLIPYQEESPVASKLVQKVDHVLLFRWGQMPDAIPKEGRLLENALKDAVWLHHKQTLLYSESL